MHILAEFVSQDNSDTGIKHCSVVSVQSGKTDAQGEVG